MLSEHVFSLACMALLVYLPIFPEIMVVSKVYVYIPVTLNYSEQNVYIICSVRFPFGRITRNHRLIKDINCVFSIVIIFNYKWLSNFFVIDTFSSAQCTL